MEFTDKYSFSLKRTIYTRANVHPLTHFCPRSRCFLSWLIHVILWMQVLWVVRPSVAFGGINLLHMLTVDHDPNSQPAHLCQAGALGEVSVTVSFAQASLASC